jgi:hypothetical protein
MRKFLEVYDPETVYVSLEHPSDILDSRFVFDVEDRRYLAIYQRNLDSLFGLVDWFELYEVVEVEQGNKVGWTSLRVMPKEFARLLCDTVEKSGTNAVVDLLRAEGNLDA